MTEEILETRIDSLEDLVESLQKKLDIATKALEEYSKDYFYTKGGGRYENHNPMLAQQALKEMEEV